MPCPWRLPCFIAACSVAAFLSFLPRPASIPLVSLVQHGDGSRQGSAAAALGEVKSIQTSLAPSFQTSSLLSAAALPDFAASTRTGSAAKHTTIISSKPSPRSLPPAVSLPLRSPQPKLEPSTTSLPTVVSLPKLSPQPKLKPSTTSLAPVVPLSKLTPRPKLKPSTTSLTPVVSVSPRPKPDPQQICEELKLSWTPKREVRFPEIPDHTQVKPNNLAWYPDNYATVPSLGDKVWDVGLNDTQGNLTLLHRMLLRLLVNKTIKIQVYGGSMTAGVGCDTELGRTRPLCAWPNLFADRLRQAFGSKAVELENRGRGGCGLECALPDFVIDQTRSQQAPDLVLFDFGQNEPDGNIEKMVRVGSLLLPSTAFAVLWTGDRMRKVRVARQPLNPKHRDKNIRVAEYYGAKMLNYCGAEDYYVEHGGSYEQMWKGVESNGHHPHWESHAYIADMLARWFNSGLQNLEACKLESRPTMAALAEAALPRLHVHSGEGDEHWLPPLGPGVLMRQVNTCLQPLSTHLAHRPDVSNPQLAARSSWRLYEDRPGKPGWITNRTDDWISFPVSFSKTPKAILSYLQSYQNMGQAEVVIHGEPFWTLRKRSGPLRGRAFFVHSLEKQDPKSITRNVFLRGDELDHASEGNISVRLVNGKKFKIISVITC